MEARVAWAGAMRFVGQADSGHAVVMDTTDKVGGQDSAARPSELLLLGLAGCTGMDVVSILRKKRQRVTGLEVVVRADQAESHPRRFLGFTVEYRISGTGVDPEAVRRAIELSEASYCSVGTTLKAGAPVTSTFTILPPDGD